MANFDTLTETFSLGLSDQLITRKQGELTDKKVAASTVKAALADDAATVKTKYESNSDTNAFTDAHLTKLNGIATGAEVNVNADWSASSGDAQILNKPTIPTSTTQIAEGTNLYFTTSRANTSPAGQYAIAQTCELYVGASATAGGVDPDIVIVNPNLTDVGFVGIAPYKGSKVGLYDTSSSVWELRDVVATGMSLAGLTSGVVYDLYLGFVGSALEFQSVAWSVSGAGTSTRNVTPNYVNGVPLLPSDQRYRLVGTFYTSGTGTTSDNLQNRLVSNVVHKRWKRVSISFNPTDYTFGVSGVIREFGNGVSQRIHICSADPTPVSVGANISITSSGSLPTWEASCRIGVNSITVQSGTYSLAVFQTQQQRVSASFSGLIRTGYNYLAVLETGHDGDNVTTNDPLMLNSLMDGMVFL